MVDEAMKKELWYWYFTEQLYKQGTISEDKKMELLKKISSGKA